MPKAFLRGGPRACEQVEVSDFPLCLDFPIHEPPDLVHSPRPEIVRRSFQIATYERDRASDGTGQVIDYWYAGTK